MLEDSDPKSDNENLLLRLMEARFGKSDASEFDSVLAPNYKEHEPQATQGARELKNMRTNLLNAFTNQEFSVRDKIGEGDEVVLRWEWQADHSGCFMNWQATNKKVRTSGITIAKIEEGKIVETWEEWNFAGFREQLER